MRRVGKTTLLKQLIDYIITEKKVDRKQIFFYSFDSGGDLAEQIEAYTTLLDIDLMKEQTYIFLDEIQKVPDRQSKVKVYFDQYPKIKFFLTGSSSLHLQKKESLAGRIFTYHIKPLFFDEYLRFKHLDYYLTEKAIYREKILKEFEKYLFRQFIDIIDAPIDEAKRYITELKNKVIKEDIVFYFKIEYPQLLLTIFKIIASSPGILLDYKNFADDLDIDQRTLEKYIYYLTEANLITKVYNFSKNMIKSERKLKKVYLNACSLYTGTDITGELFENYVQNTFGYEYFWRLGNKEVDFVDYAEGKIQAVEVKYKSKLKKEDIKGIQALSHKFPVNKKLIISKDLDTYIDDVEVKSFYR
ncbi:MAG: ATP-binding protein [Candidatus Peribacteria bacterium]|jgi:predicted AAA+ superfamily ATPase|nr:ATP-binding protein [Candidatus Peribacteria bacterium]